MTSSRKKTAVYKYTGKPCKNGHIGPRYSNGNCVQCLLDRHCNNYKDSIFAEEKRQAQRVRYSLDIEASRQKNRETRLRNLDSILESQRIKYNTDSEFKEKCKLQSKTWRLLNLEKARIRDREYHLINRDSRNENSKAYKRKQSPQRLLEIQKKAKEYFHIHYSKNLEYYWFKRVNRRLREAKATPKWVDKKEVMRLKEASNQLTKVSGEKQSIDHIVPLIGKNKFGNHIVCGLNWEGNMQIMSLQRNKEKGHRTWPDMPEDWKW